MKAQPRLFFSMRVIPSQGLETMPLIRSWMPWLQTGPTSSRTGSSGDGLCRLLHIVTIFGQI